MDYKQKTKEIRQAMLELNQVVYGNIQYKKSIARKYPYTPEEAFKYSHHNRFMYGGMFTNLSYEVKQDPMLIVRAIDGI